MRFIALVKQVPDTKDQRFTDQHSVLREGLDLICNPYDEYALEEAVRLKERFSGEAWALSMGKPSAADLMRFALSIGADEVRLVSDPAIAGSDLLATADILAAALRKCAPFDLILGGKQSSDGENGVIPAAVAGFLDLPCVIDVCRIVDISGGVALVEQMIPGGHNEVEIRLPAVLGVLKDINEPRLPSLKGKLAARSAQVPVWSLSDIGIAPGAVGAAGALTRISGVHDAPGKAGVQVFSGDVEEAVAALVRELLERKLI